MHTKLYECFMAQDSWIYDLVFVCWNLAETCRKFLESDNHRTMLEISRMTVPLLFVHGGFYIIDCYCSSWEQQREYVGTGGCSLCLGSGFRVWQKQSVPPVMCHAKDATNMSSKRSIEYIYIHIEYILMIVRLASLHIVSQSWALRGSRTWWDTSARVCSCKVLGGGMDK